MRTLLSLMLPFFCAALIAGSPAKKPVKNTAAAPVVVTAKEAKERYFGKPEVVFIDNRTDADFCSGHIPGAVNLPYCEADTPGNRLTKEALAPFAGKKLLFYCRGMIRAKNAVEAVRSWGIDPARIIWLKEGFPAWKKAGYPVETTEAVCPI